VVGMVASKDKRGFISFRELWKRIWMNSKTSDACACPKDLVKQGACKPKHWLWWLKETGGVTWNGNYLLTSTPMASLALSFNAYPVSLHHLYSEVYLPLPLGHYYQVHRSGGHRHHLIHYGNCSTVPTRSAKEKDVSFA